MMSSAEKLAAMCEEAQGKGWDLDEIVPPTSTRFRYEKCSVTAAEDWIELGLAPAIGLNHALWRALKGEEMVCCWCGDTDEAHVCKTDRGEMSMPAYLYHVGECARAAVTVEAMIDWSYRAVFGEGAGLSRSAPPPKRRFWPDKRVE
jgi:hypothetical protein